MQKPMISSYFPHEVADVIEIGVSVPLVVLRGGFRRVIQNRRPVRLMLLEVPIQVGLLPKTSVTQRTFERLLLVVDVADMALQVGRDTEGSLAVLAFVGLFPRVGPKVAGQVRRSWKNFSTELACVALLRFHHLWCQQVLGPRVVVMMVRRVMVVVIVMGGRRGLATLFLHVSPHEVQCSS